MAERENSSLHRAALEAAWVLLRQGRPGDAEATCHDFLRQDGEDAAVLHLLAEAAQLRGALDEAAALRRRCGNCLLARGDAAGALTHFDAAVALRGDFAEAQDDRGLALQALGRIAEALLSHDLAVTLAPELAQAWHHRGTALWRLAQVPAALSSLQRALALNPALAAAQDECGAMLLELDRPEQALACIDRALALRPDFPAALNHRGMALTRLGRPEAALACHDAALALQPDLAEAHAQRATALHRLGRRAEAAASAERAISLAPDDAAVLALHGVILHAQGQCAAALRQLDRALALVPQNPAWLLDRSALLAEMGQPEAALADAERVLALRPDQPEALNNRAVALLQLGQAEAALEWLDLAVALRPHYAVALSNRGLALQELHRFAEAISSHREAVQAAPDQAAGHHHLALALLQQGRFAEAWPEFEWRPGAGLRRGAAPRFALPRWTGAENIAGHRVLLHWEQGLGDTIQFCRYALKVREHGGQVVLLVQRALRALCSSLDPEIIVIGPDDAVPECDYHCPMLSLPAAFGTVLATIPAQAGYLRAERARRADWLQRLPPSGPPRIGIAWHGSPEHRNDAARSIPLHLLRDLLGNEADWICLHPQLKAAEAELLGAFAGVRSPAGELADFADTAAVIAELDLVISVDTAIAHLAGALGKPVWILLPHNPDWRWLLERPDSPWYPDARLFRQAVPGDWQAALGRLGAALQSWLHRSP